MQNVKFLYSPVNRHSWKLQRSKAYINAELAFFDFKVALYGSYELPLRWEYLKWILYSNMKPSIRFVVFHVSARNWLAYYIWETSLFLEELSRQFESNKIKDCERFTANKMKMSNPNPDFCAVAELTDSASMECGRTNRHVATPRAVQKVWHRPPRLSPFCSRLSIPFRTLVSWVAL